MQFAILAAIFVYGAVTLDGFSSATSIKSMLLLAAFLGLAALGQTVLVLLGHLDLSVPGLHRPWERRYRDPRGADGWVFVPCARRHRRRRRSSWAG